MKILTFSPSLRRIECALTDTESLKTLFNASFTDWRGEKHTSKILNEVKTKILPFTGEAAKGKTASLSISVRIPFGGPKFEKSEICDELSVSELEKFISYSPLHLPPLISLIGLIKNIFPEVKIALAFETAFFTALPDREKYYAISPDIDNAINFRRYGYHGLFHKHAATKAKEEYNVNKIISICLENRPEVSAIADGRPCMVSSGATPLEGLPGLHSCGEIDPMLITAISKKMDIGPEEINNILTTQSGLAAVCEKNDIIFEDIFENDSEKYKLARYIFLYGVLKYCGIGIASMGSFEMIVFSGRHAALLGDKIGRWLKENLSVQPASKGIPYNISINTDIHSILAAEAIECLES